jgi:polyribonucleotide nucleotidyltransferase
MISDLTAVPEIGKTYLGKVVRLAEFGAFVEIFPGTDGLLHVSEIAEHRVKEVKDELREGDQILVKVLAIEGNRIKLSRKAVLREQRAKLGLPEPGQEGGGDSHAGDDQPRRERSHDRQPSGDRQPASNQSTITIEGGDDFDEEDSAPAEGGDEPNFNRADAPAPGPGAPQGERGPGGDRRPGGRRRRGGRKPGQGGGGAPRPAGGDGGANR